MIKKLKSKLIICLFLLVTIFNVTSSCFAVEQNYVTMATLADYGLTFEDFCSGAESIIINNKLDYNFNDFKDNYYIYYFNGKVYCEFYFFEDISTIDLYSIYYGGIRTVYAYSGSTNISNNVGYRIQVYYSVDANSFGATSNITQTTDYLTTCGGTSYEYKFIDSSAPFYYSDSKVSNVLIYEPKILIDTSFDYSFEGTKRGQTKLTINNLGSSLKMYGYVDLGTTFALGDTLDITSNINNLRLMATRSDNSDLYCYLYEGEELNYYILDENNVILDTGYISEMSKGYFLYGFEVNNGVDFVFLRDGQVYWDNTLTFKYSVGSSEQYVKNDIVSMSQSSYIITDKTVSSNTYSGFVYDSSNSLIAKSSVVNFNDLSSISVSVNTAYTENNVGWNKSCYWLMSFSLLGTNADGSLIDFSNYYAKWSVPTWLNLESIEFNGEEYTKSNGIIDGFTSSGYSGLFNLKIFELVKNHKSSFDIKLEIYDSEDNLVLTYIINSDDIVKKQVASEENNVDKGDYDILDNPNYTGGSNNYPSSDNIHNWGVDDFANYLGTNNTMFNFFWAFLNNMPTWISTPLTILLIGLVVITLYKFIRG